MKDKKLQETLKKINIPEPEKYAKEEAVNAAMQAFREEKSNIPQQEEPEKKINFEKNIKGNDNHNSQISRTNIINLFWRNMMKKSHVIGGSATALVLVLMVSVVTQYEPREFIGTEQGKVTTNKVVKNTGGLNASLGGRLMSLSDNEEIKVVEKQRVAIAPPPPPPPPPPPASMSAFSPNSQMVGLTKNKRGRSSVDSNFEPKYNKTIISNSPAEISSLSESDDSFAPKRSTDAGASGARPSVQDVYRDVYGDNAISTDSISIVEEEKPSFVPRKAEKKKQIASKDTQTEHYTPKFSGVTLGINYKNNKEGDSGAAAAFEDKENILGVAISKKKDNSIKRDGRLTLEQEGGYDEVAPRVKTIMPYPLPHKHPTICCAPPPPPPPPPPPVYREHNRDNFEQFIENEIKQVRKEPVSTFSIDVDTASYAFARKALNNGHLPNKNSVRMEELINYFNYDYEIPKDRREPFKPYLSVFPTPWNENSKLLHVGIQGYDIDKSERPKANLVFLIDVSGSMNAPDKLPLLKNSMRMMVDSLNPDDTVSIAVYAGAAGAVLEPTSVRNKHQIFSAIDRLNAGGSTAGGAGINLAYSLAQQNFDKKAVNRIILATDGDFNVGLRNTEDLKRLVERKRKSGVFLSVLGFGKGNYNDKLMQTLAQNGNGNASYIDNLNEARKVLVDEAGSTLLTIAKDVKIQIEFNPKVVSDYRLIGYETRKLKREDFNNDKIDAGEIGAGHEVTALYEIVTSDTKVKMVDDLRYGKKDKILESKDSTEENIIKYDSKSEEYGFFKLRYKLPDENKSRLITTPITKKSEVKNINNASREDRFAASVAAFAQLLRGSKYIYDYSYKEVADLASTARGDDKFGYRNEFVRLVRLAESMDSIERPSPIMPMNNGVDPIRYRY